MRTSFYVVLSICLSLSLSTCSSIAPLTTSSTSLPPLLLLNTTLFPKSGNPVSSATLKYEKGTFRLPSLKHFLSTFHTCKSAYTKCRSIKNVRYSNIGPHTIPLTASFCTSDNCSFRAHIASKAQWCLISTFTARSLPPASLSSFFLPLRTPSTFAFPFPLTPTPLLWPTPSFTLTLPPAFSMSPSPLLLPPPFPPAPPSCLFFKRISPLRFLSLLLLLPVPDSEQLRCLPQ